MIILAGGLGTRLSEETESKPKPMVLIGDKPILWHLMNLFSKQGYSEFVLALGYRSDVIKRWLVDLNQLDGSISLDTGSKKVSRLDESNQNPWKITALETGLNTQTGGRIAQCMRAFPGERMIATYGDGLANLSVDKLVSFHSSHGRLATVTAVRPPARFGYLNIENKAVTHFSEKNQSDVGWINGGFFVLEPDVANLVSGDMVSFESEVLPQLAKRNQLMAHHHYEFWQPMDTLREKQELTKLALEAEPPWLRGI